MILKWKPQAKECPIGLGIVVKCNDKFYLTNKVTDKQVWTTSQNRLVKENCVVYRAHSYVKNDVDEKVLAIPHFRTYATFFTNEQVLDELPTFADLRLISIHRRLCVGESVRIIDGNLPEKLVGKTIVITHIRTNILYDGNLTEGNVVQPITKIRRYQVKSDNNDLKWLIVE